MNQDQLDQRASLRSMTRGFYDLQKIRIQTGLRLVANYRAKLGLIETSKATPDETSLFEDLDLETTDTEPTDEAVKAKKIAAATIMADLKKGYTRLTDAIAENPDPAKPLGDPIIDSYAEWCLIGQYIEMVRLEAGQLKQIERVVKAFTLYTNYLSNIKMVGPTTGAVLITEIDISKSKYVSSLWKYAGLDVAEDGRGRSWRKEHLVKRAYIDKKGKPQERDSITYNPFLKTKLFVFATNFIKGKNDYSVIYYNYKHRLESSKPDWTKGHRHNAALRYMMKMFLKDLYNYWRAAEGLPVMPPYDEAKLGHIHTQAAA